MTPAESIEGKVRCECGSKYWDDSPNGPVCHSCGWEAWLAVKAMMSRMFRVEDA